MRIKLQVYFTILLVLVTTIPAWGGQGSLSTTGPHSEYATSSPMPIHPAANNTNPSNMKNNFISFICPPPNTIKKDSLKLTWSADRNMFRSYETSFATQIKSFSGAQWVGSALGQITCIYEALPIGSFPVLLIFHTLALEPKTGSWSANQGGYRNCRSTNYKACPFMTQASPPKEDVYEEAERLKSDAPAPPSE